MWPAVPTITLFVGVDIIKSAPRIAPLWMLLEERIRGQTAATILRRRFRRRWIAPRRADRARQEWACQRSENRRPHESLPWELLCGPGLLIWIPPVNLLDGHRAWRSRSHGRKPFEWPWLPAPKRRRRRRRLSLQVLPVSRHGVWERRRSQLPSWFFDPCS